MQALDSRNDDRSWVPPEHPDERRRVAEVHARNLLAISDDRLAAYTALSAHMFEAPIAHVGIVDSNRNWIKSPIGLDMAYCEREESFCAHAVLERDMLVVRDTRDDARFRRHPMVVGRSRIRFYAAAVIRCPRSDLPLGTLCVIDRRPRTFTQRDRTLLGHVRDLLSKEMFDFSEREAELDSLLREAMVDEVTNLPGPRLVLKATHDQLLAAAEGASTVSVLAIELARLDEVMRARGRGFVDRVLRSVADRLSQIVPSHATLGRWRDDRFAVVTRIAPSDDELSALGHRLVNVFVSPFDVDGEAMALRPRIAGASWPDDGVTSVDLWRAASDALSQLPAGSHGFTLRDRQLDTVVARRFELEQGLRTALVGADLSAVYQPKIDLHTGAVIGAEALARWRHPTLGAVPPSEFIPVAVHAGIIGDLGAYVLDLACREAAGWEDERLTIAVNVAASELQATGYVDQVAESLSRSGLAPHRLTIEITESSMLDETATATANLERLTRLGASISIDDFGTGFSSFNMLRDLPISQVKIDKTFVDDITFDGRRARICHAIIAMARSLAFTVVAEGVETHDQATYLKAYGCDQAQGYLYSRPVPASEFRALVEPR